MKLALVAGLSIFALLVILGFDALDRQRYERWLEGGR